MSERLCPDCGFNTTVHAMYGMCPVVRMPRITIPPPPRGEELRKSRHLQAVVLNFARKFWR